MTPLRLSLLAGTVLALGAGLGIGLGLIAEERTTPTTSWEMVQRERLAAQTKAEAEADSEPNPRDEGLIRDPRRRIAEGQYEPPPLPAPQPGFAAAYLGFDTALATDPIGPQRLAPGEEGRDGMRGYETGVASAPAVVTAPAVATAPTVVVAPAVLPQRRPTSPSSLVTTALPLPPLPLKKPDPPLVSTESKETRPQPAAGRAIAAAVVPSGSAIGRSSVSGGWRQAALVLPEEAWERSPLFIRPDPMVAVIIDDMGLGSVRTRQVEALIGPLTLSYLSYAPDLRAQAERGRAAGHEIMLHMPMQPLNGSIDPGPGALQVGLPAAEVRRRVETALDRIGPVVAVNNHMGSRFTQNRPGMAAVMDVLERRDLLWVDSVTDPATVGNDMASERGLLSLRRTVFIDHDNNRAAIDRQLAQLERLALARGMAIGIAHPRPATIAALRVWLPRLAERGVRLVPVSTLALAALAETGSTETIAQR